MPAAVVVWIVTNYVIAIQIAIVIVSTAYSMDRARKAKKAAKEAANAAQTDRLVNITSTVAKRDAVFGRVRKSGAVFYKASTGENNKDMYMAIALAGHEIDAVEAIYLNDELVTLNANGEVTSEPYSIRSTASGVAPSFAAVPAGAFNVNKIFRGLGGGGSGESQEGYEDTGNYSYQIYEYHSNVKINIHLGAPGQTVDPMLRAAFPDAWGDNHVVQGVAYLVAKLTFNETSFPSGLPAISAVVRGAKLYDPRDGQTRWSENPALMMRWLYTSSFFGKAAVTAEEDARISTAANNCDIPTQWVVGFASHVTHPMFRASLVQPYGGACDEAFTELATAMAGSWAFAGGSLFVRAGVYTNPVMNLTEADLEVVNRSVPSATQTPIKIGVHRARAQQFNTAKVVIWDQGQDSKQVSLTPLVGADLITRDGAELVQDFQFSAIGYAPQALHVAGILMRDARDPLTVEIPFKLSAYKLELFDNVSLTLARYGWVDKVFTVQGRTWTTEGTILLTLKETSAAIFSQDASFLPQGYAINTNLPKPWLVAPVGALTIASGTAELLKQSDGTVVSRMRVSWPQSADGAVLQGGRIEVQYRLSTSSAEWTQLVVSGSDTTVVTAEVTDNAFYIIRARARTSTGVSDWNTQVQAQVIGKTAPPSNVSNVSYTFEPVGVRISWTPIPDADLSVYELRTNGSSWETSTKIGQSVSSNYLWNLQITGARIVRIKAIDTSVNYSATEAIATIQIGGPVATVGFSTLVGTDLVLTWQTPYSEFLVDLYEIRRGATYATSTFVDSTKALGFRIKADFGGSQNWYITGIDAAGNAGEPATVLVSISVPDSVAPARSEVIDNNALLYWTAPTIDANQLPIDRYEGRRGVSWALGFPVVSNGNSTFTAIFEQTAGTYVYWISAVDSANNYGPAVNIQALINQPPDYILQDDYNTNFPGTWVNFYQDSPNNWIGPVNLNQTWASHYSDNGFGTAADQTAAGYPLYPEPGLATGSYEEVIDYEAVIPSTTVAVSLMSQNLDGEVTAICSISYKTNLGDAWVDLPAGISNAVMPAFRYLKVRFNFTCTAGANLASVTGINVKLSIKLRNDSGEGVAAVGGTVVYFKYAFLDADTPIVQPLGSTPKIPAERLQLRCQDCATAANRLHPLHRKT